MSCKTLHAISLLMSLLRPWNKHNTNCHVLTIFYAPNTCTDTPISPYTFLLTPTFLVLTLPLVPLPLSFPSPFPLTNYFTPHLNHPPPLSQSTFSFVPLSSLSLLPIHPSPSLTCFLPCSHHIMSLLLPSLTFKNIFQQTYGWTTASSMRSILFWTKTHGILVPHSSTTCQTKVP